MHPFFTSTLVLPLLLPLLPLTATHPTQPHPLLLRRDAVAQLLTIAPTASTCTGAALPSECATASEAVGPLIAGFSQYGISSAGEQAALLAWMAFESADFKYNANHFPAPGTPGQGTRCMMSPAYVARYAASIPAVSAAAAAAQGAAGPAAVLALVQPDEYSFAAASWFVSTQCSAAVRQGLAAGTEAAWEAWVTGCVGTTVTDARKAYWQRAVAALGV